MLGIIETQRYVSYSIYKGLCQYGVKPPRKGILFLNKLCQHCLTQQQHFSSVQLKNEHTVGCKYRKTQCMIPGKWIHVSVNIRCKSENKEEINQGDNSIGSSNKLDPVNSSKTSYIGIGRERSPTKCTGNSKDKHGKKKQIEADAFVKKRFYNIEKTAKVAEISQLKLARERGEITDLEFENQLQKLEESFDLKEYLGNSSSQLTVVKRDTKIGKSNTSTVKVAQGETESIIRSLIREIDSNNTHELGPVQYESENLPSTCTASEEPVTVPFPKLYHLAPLVNENTVLRNLVTVGVDLSKVERQGYADSVMKLDFNKDVKPLLLYLHDIGVPGDKVGHVLGKNASLLVMDLEHFKTRIAYLRSKKFKRDDIAEMIVKNPNFLYYSTEKLDQSLGYLQKQLWLTGDELRQFVTRAPKVITMDPAKIQNHVYLFQDEFGFTKREVKKMVLNYASVLKIDLKYLAERFYYLHETMLIPYSSLIEWPEALRKNLNLIKNRHKFLEIQGRAQYNPELPNYVSLKRLLATDDTEFSCEIAKASLAEYNNFLRTV